MSFHTYLFEYIVLASSFIFLYHGIKIYTENFVTKICSPDKCEWMYLFLSALVYTAILKSIPRFSSNVFAFN